MSHMDRPFETLSDEELRTLAERGSAEAINEMAIRHQLAQIQALIDRVRDEDDSRK